MWYKCKDETVGFSLIIQSTSRLQTSQMKVERCLYNVPNYNPHLAYHHDVAASAGLLMYMVQQK